MAERSILRSGLFGLAVSLLLHLSLGLLAGENEPEPFVFEFEIPADLELGINDEMLLAEGTNEETAAPLEEPVAPESESGGAYGTDAGVPDAGPADSGVPDSGRPDSGVPDSGRPDLGRPDLGSEAQDAGEEDDAGDESDADGETGEGEGDVPGENGNSRIPPGAQLALRLDMDRVRASRLAPQVSRLLDAIPDWHALLDGSGIDPMVDLDRLLIASPNFRRSRFVFAGRHAHPSQGTRFIEQTVQRLAQSRGETSTWRREQGVRVATWHNDDPTPRVVAIIGPRHFTITRQADLVRILAIAAVRAEPSEPTSGDDEEETPGQETLDGPDEEGDSEEPVAEQRGPDGGRADALLSMRDAEAFSFEADGVHRFVRTVPGMHDIALLPVRFRVGLTDTGQGVQLDGLATYESEEQAIAALAFWTAERDRRVDEAPFLVRGVIRAIHLSQSGVDVTVQLRTNYMVATIMLGQITGSLVAAQRAADTPADSPEPSANPANPTGDSPEPSSNPANPANPTGDSPEPSANPANPADPTEAPASSRSEEHSGEEGPEPASAGATPMLPRSETHEESDGASN